MSTEDSVKVHMENELEVAKKMAHLWKTQMTNVFCYLKRQGKIAKTVREEYEQHIAKYEIVIKNEDIRNIKELTVVMNLFAITLYTQWNALINTNLTAFL
ncbi:hypothetical protein CAEBREN_14071 [Caenorhabditis brenneri]|uniref:Uncharacterized protein n=1 Tax=Caenorhabditis brenneri TaxID=135651 RepID=G0MI38_CAEBE|nr:hypothetical protein CAEBREN_14071 [Caenorhabditis brenneri]